jgi:maleate isomerase
VRLEKQTQGIPVVSTGLSASLAFRALGVRRIAIIHPPWFAAELDRRGAEYFRAGGFDVLYHAPAALQYDYGGVDAPRLYEWARTKVPKEADALFVGGNGFRAVGAIHALEQALSKPVLTANQVTFWHALRLGGVHTSVTGYGRIFTRELPRA